MSPTCRAFCCVAACNNGQRSHDAHVTCWAGGKQQACLLGELHCRAVTALEEGPRRRSGLRRPNAVRVSAARRSFPNTTHLQQTLPIARCLHSAAAPTFRPLLIAHTYPIVRSTPLTSIYMSIDCGNSGRTPRRFSTALGQSTKWRVLAQPLTVSFINAAHWRLCFDRIGIHWFALGVAPISCASASCAGVAKPSQPLHTTQRLATPPPCHFLHCSVQSAASRVVAAVPRSCSGSGPGWERGRRSRLAVLATQRLTGWMMPAWEAAAAE
jgi:hypothetical protein